MLQPLHSLVQILHLPQPGHMTVKNIYCELWAMLFLLHLYLCCLA